MAHRLASPLIRHILEGVRAGEIAARAAAEMLEVSRNRVYQLYGDYLRAVAAGRSAEWTPGVSGGDHTVPWPSAVTELLHRRLTSKPPASYSFAASEVLRLCGFRLDRAQVRRWAIAHGLAHGKLPRRPLAPVRRWQRHRVGELWQMDASPHRWFPQSETSLPMLNMLDDCSRVFVASRLYERETLEAYLDFLPRAFQEYGLPLEIYVDYHSFFFSSAPHALTALGQALHFYGVSLRYAPTPQAKGKIEREHQFWQRRLPAYFASEPVQDLPDANRQITALRLHRNQREVHRELGQTPQHAWEEALNQGRCALRPVPPCPWWPYIWSVRKTLRSGDDGRIPIGPHRVRLEVPPRSPLTLCFHPSGHTSVLAHPPAPNTLPVILFTNRPT